jgi:predicted RNA binding protein YcfA (HicA-like mRNA interferase family)
MGGELPVLKPKQVVKILNKLGFVLARQKGSHQQFLHSDRRATTVPMHSSRDLSPILLRQICKDINLTTTEFLKAK